MQHTPEKINSDLIFRLNAQASEIINLRQQLESVSYKYLEHYVKGLVYDFPFNSSKPQDIYQNCVKYLNESRDFDRLLDEEKHALINKLFKKRYGNTYLISNREN